MDSTLSLKRNIIATIGNYAILHIQTYKTQLTNKTMNKKGFTLIELLVVVVIIGILATAGFSAFTSAQKKARDGIRTNDVGQIKGTIETDFMNESNWEDYGTAAVLTTLLNDNFGKFPADPDGSSAYLVCLINVAANDNEVFVAAASEASPGTPIVSSNVTPSTSATR